MAPPPPPELMDDLISEILLHLPPEDPVCLVRASLICKPWRRLHSDGAFLRQYSTFHQTPPVLGFFQDQYRKGTSVPQYVPTIQASPVPQPTIAVASGPTTSCYTLDCRHGRVLFQAEDQPSQTLTVWDPITGNHKRISIGDPLTTFDLAGFAEDTGSIFISANDDISLLNSSLTRSQRRAREQVAAPSFLSWASTLMILLPLDCKCQ